jgi:hypothetical protein
MTLWKLTFTYTGVEAGGGRVRFDPRLNGYRLRPNAYRLRVYHGSKQS